MTKLRKPDGREQEAIAKAKDTLNRLWIKDTETKLDNILIETAEIYIGYVANDLAAAYRDIEKMHIIPESLNLAVKIRAAELFIRHNARLNTRIQNLYKIEALN